MKTLRGPNWVRVLHPKIPTLLVTELNGKINVMTASWVMPVSHDPPLLAASVSPRRFTHELITKTNEFTVNVPSKNLLREVKYCGSVSGRNVDKTRELKLTFQAGEKVKSPVIKECLGWLECKVGKSVEAGDHTLFIAEVLICKVDEGMFKETWNPERSRVLLHLGGDRYISTAGLE